MMTKVANSTKRVDYQSVGSTVKMITHAARRRHTEKILTSERWEVFIFFTLRVCVCVPPAIRNIMLRFIIASDSQQCWQFQYHVDFDDMTLRWICKVWWDVEIVTVLLKFVKNRSSYTVNQPEYAILRERMWLNMRHGSEVVCVSHACFIEKTRDVGRAVDHT